MIEGLHFDFRGSELIEHLRRRVDHHTQRNAFYREQVARLDEGGHVDEDFTGGNPAKQFKEKAEKHFEKAQEFEILASHLVPTETYRLKPNDLRQIEIVTTNWY